MSRRGKGPRPADALRFVTVWTPLIWGVLRRRGVPERDVDDACQEVLVRAWLAAKEGRLAFGHAPAAHAWVKVVAWRLGAKWAAKRRRAALADDLDPAEREDDAEEPMLARDLLAELRDSTTPANWRAWLAVAQGATVAEHAKAEGIPEGTAHTRVRLARRDFAAALARERAREAAPVRRRKK